MTQAQSKLGELFVDIGLSGLGKTIQGLNAVSAGFLLTKNAATQAIRPFSNIAKNAMNNATAYGKMNASLGVSLETIQKLSAYLNRYDIGDGLINDLGSIMDMLNRVANGTGALDSAWANALTRMGLDWRKYRKGTFDDMLNMVSDIQTRFSELGWSQSKRRIYLQDLGLTPELLYAFDRNGFNISNFRFTSDEEIKNVQILNQEINELNKNLQQLGITTTGKLAPTINNVLKDYNSAMKGDKNAQLRSGIRTVGAAGGVVPGALIGLGIGGLPGLVIGGLLGLSGGFGMLKATDKIMDLQGTNIPLPQSPTGFASQIDINITNHNSINGNNAQEIADSIEGINIESIEEAANNRFQAANKISL